MTPKTRNAIRLVVAVLLAAAWVLYLRWNWERSRNGAVAQKATCVNNLRQIGLAFYTWAIDNGDKVPFNISTNAGGTLEFCTQGSGGFDSNAALHFQVMSNELSTPLLLVCPQDCSKKRAATFDKLGPENVTYRLRTGTNITVNAQPKEILVVCPIDGNTLYSDGTVSGKTEEPKDDGHGVPMNVSGAKP